MGFSLGRALAGAIAGGAGAAASIADLHIKEAAASREREAQFERQRQLMREQDEIIAAREQRVADTKLRMEKERRAEISGFMKTQLNALKEQKIDPGSIQGQRAIAAAAAEAGYQEYADKFYDNAIKLGQIESVAESNRESRALREQTAQMAHEDARARREEITDRKAAEREEKEELKRQNELYRLGNITGQPDREGKAPKFDATPRLIGVYREAMGSGMSPDDAFGAALAVRKGIDLQLNKGVDFETAADRSVGVVVGQWRQPAQNDNTQKPPVVQTQPAPQAPAPKEKKYIPSFVEKLSGMTQPNEEQPGQFLPFK